MSEASEIQTEIFNDTADRYAPRYPGRHDFMMAMMAEQIRLLREIRKEMATLRGRMPVASRGPR